MSGIGHGQSFSFGGTAIDYIEDVQFNGKGTILSKVVADQTYPITASVPGTGKWTVTFNMPATTPHTYLANIARGEEKAVIHNNVDGVKLSGTAISNGYDISSPSGGWVTCKAEFTANGAVTVEAAA